MGTAVYLSLPPEQLALLEVIRKQQELLLESANSEAWLTDEMVAKRFHRSVSTIRRWREDFGLPYRQLGDARLYIPNEVDEWMRKSNTIEFVTKISAKAA